MNISILQLNISSIDEIQIKVHVMFTSISWAFLHRFMTFSSRFLLSKDESDRTSYGFETVLDSNFLPISETECHVGLSLIKLPLCVEKCRSKRSKFYFVCGSTVNFPSTGGTTPNTNIKDHGFYLKLVAFLLLLSSTLPVISIDSPERVFFWLLLVEILSGEVLPVQDIGTLRFTMPEEI